MKTINVTRSSMPEFEEYTSMIKEIWDSRWLTNCGKFHNELESELTKYLQVENVSLFTNGHLALYTALNALDLKGEVITTPFTFASTTHAIVQNGLTPVFCDINTKDYTIDVDKLEQLITDKTCAIVAVHVYGNVCDVQRIESIAKKHNLHVIYDAAHAFGEEVNNKGIGNYGDISMFSFHATKVFHTIEGGGLTYNNSSYKDKIFKIRNFGLTDTEDALYVGTNAKMNEFQAAMGLCNLKHIDEYIEKRKVLVKRYQEDLKEVMGITYWQEQENVKHNYIYFPIIVDEQITACTRDDIISELSKNNINARKYFYPLTNDFTCYKDKYRGDTPIAREIANRVMTLPLYSDLEVEEVDQICNLIKRRCKK